MEFMSAPWWSALLAIILIDLVLAGDNAIVIGLAAAGLPKDQRTKVIFIGIAAATVLRIGLALVTTQLLSVVGLLLAGGLLLLWVCWKMYRELARPAHAHSLGAAAVTADGGRAGTVAQMSFWTALWQIIVADVSMSLDNVLAVAGAARILPVAPPTAANVTIENGQKVLNVPLPKGLALS